MQAILKMLTFGTKAVDVREHEDEYEFVEEDYVFQHNFKGYYVRKTSSGTEFWGRDRRYQDDNYYLGKVIGDKIYLSKGFYTLPYDVQRAGGRLFRVYLHNDWREL